MNWKYILIVIILAVIVGAGILIYSRTTKITEEPVAEETVIVPDIEIISPNGGEEWVMGQKHMIKLSDQPVKYLEEDADCMVYSIQLIDENRNYVGTISCGYFTPREAVSQIPTEIEWGTRTVLEACGAGALTKEVRSGKYKVRIADRYSSEIIDESDDFFSILEDEIADWQIYINKEHGFEMKYPQSLCLEEKKDTIEFSDCELPIKINVIIAIKNTELSIHDYFKKYGTEEKAEGLYSRKCDPICLYTSVSEIKNIYINNLSALQFKCWLYVTSGMVTLFKKSPTILIEAVNFHPLLSLGELSEIETPQQQESKKKEIAEFSDTIYNQMLSTFRFLE